MLKRRSFLQYGVGAAAVAGFAITGSVPAFAAPNPIDQWVDAQVKSGTLPTTYSSISAYPMDYRRAIFGALPAEKQSAVWAAHLDLRLADSKLNSDQRALIGEVRAVLADPATYVSGTNALDDIKQKAVGLFGEVEASNVFATLGTPQEEPNVNPSSGERGCTCANTSDWCNNSTHCFKVSNCTRHKGCGLGWLYVCNGFCRN
ncbi:bacteriocin fulvocin C-related protein [Epidermidibacterium keratini]|uniref:Bacteriocin fulvocin C-related protein n=1 Tax=Epidermidibacterium keratini TaxID=1891644 RepID=A0A7L4YSV6_9ACTN|nr:bacteriocin fulvocin C-related protein [Epidermidibacterium keratini]QHC01617.1 bacteriocin fulvocin C-related protein [Epidermidibacterium keratini]